MYKSKAFERYNYPLFEFLSFRWQAVEQIRLADEVKITKEKLKEVEEEWQNNLLNWKSKRRKSRSSGNDNEESEDNQPRKIKTFSEILNEKAKSGHRIGYNLHKYVGLQDGEEEGDENGDLNVSDKNKGEFFCFSFS